jgi:hypothetical protein
MFQTDQPTAVSAIPTPAAAGTQGFFTGGNPAAGQPATIVDNDWLNMIQQELINVVDAGGETPSKTTYNQVLLAIKALIGQPQTNLVSGVVGQVRNLVMSVTAASASATLTADEIIVETALGGLRYCLPSFHETINLATTGAGGMDTGTAPVSGYVGIYAIWNPTAGTAALLATNAASLLPSVYGGANMPGGYTASALVGVWLTNSSGLFPIGIQLDRALNFAALTALNSAASAASYTSLAITHSVPANAKTASGWMAGASTVAAGLIMNIASDASGTGAQLLQAYMDLTSASANWTVPLRTAQTIFYNGTVSSGTVGLSIGVTGYTF